MDIKKILLFILFFFSIALFNPNTSKAFDLNQIFASEDSILVKIQEGVEYFFNFKVENKIQVLEKHAEKRLIKAQTYADENNQEKVQNQLQNYLQIKERQNDLINDLTKDNRGEAVLEMVQERTIEQQKTMEEIKAKVEGDQKQLVIQAQEQVVNQVAEKVVEVSGTEGQIEFFQKVEHVWAPGTSAGGQSGVVIEGGSMQFAPGTSAGGNSGADIKTVEIKTGGDTGDSQNMVPNTAPAGGENKIDSSGGNPDGSEGSKTWIDP